MIEQKQSKTQKTKVITLDPKIVFEPYPDPKDSILGPQKVKNDPKTKSKSKARIKVDIENKSSSTI